RERGVQRAFELLHQGNAPEYPVGIVQRVVEESAGARSRLQKLEIGAVAVGPDCRHTQELRDLRRQQRLRQHSGTPVTGAAVTEVVAEDHVAPGEAAREFLVR